MSAPKVRHSTSGKTVKRVKNLLAVLKDYHLNGVVARMGPELEGKLDSPSSLLDLRKMLRDEVNAAFYEKDDRVNHYDLTGEVTNKGHELRIMVLAACIHYLMDEALQERIKAMW
jgi:hypothetical protein